MSTVEVNREALYRVLTALNAPTHHIREMQATRTIAKLTGETNPIDVLITDFNRALEKTTATDPLFGDEQ